MRLAQDHFAVRADDGVSEGARSGLEQEMKIVLFVQLRFRPAERNERPDRKYAEDVPLVRVGQAHVEEQSLQVVGLLQRVFADFRRAGRHGHAKFLLPEFRAANDLKIFRPAGHLLIPLLDLDRGGDGVAARLAQIKIRHQVL